MSPNSNSAQHKRDGQSTPVARTSFNPLLTPPETPMRPRSDRPPITRVKKQSKRAKKLHQFEKKLRASRPPNTHPIPPALVPPLPPPDPGPSSSLESPFVDQRDHTTEEVGPTLSPNANVRKRSLIDLTTGPSSPLRGHRERAPPVVGSHRSYVRKSATLTKNISSNGRKYALTHATSSSPKDDEVIEITSDSGPEQPYLAPGEKWYYGPSTKRSRIGSTLTDQPSPPRTRGWRKREDKPVSSEDEKHNAVHARRPPTIEDFETKAKRLAEKEQERVFRAWANPEYERVLRKRLPVAPRPDYVVPELPNDDDDPPDALIGLGIRKKDQVPNSSPVPRPSSSGALHAHHVMDQTMTDDNGDFLDEADSDDSSSHVEDPRPRKKRNTQTVSFLADEAEDDGTGPGSEEDDMYTDEYDREDSFIDDSPLPSTRPHGTRSTQMKEADVTSDGDDGNFLPSDEETALQVAKIQSVFSDLRPHLSQEEYDSKLKTIARAFKVASKTGENKTTHASKKSHSSSLKGKERAFISSDDDQVYDE
ncbi:hypothetical protein MD484_g8043, partial [Candolleomyces efflorescens]